jgi:hypothetical protein
MSEERLRYYVCWRAESGEYSELFEDLSEARDFAKELLVGGTCGTSVVYIEHQRFAGPGWLTFETEDAVSETKRRLILGPNQQGYFRGIKCGVCHRYFSSKDSAFIEVGSDTFQFLTAEGHRLVCDGCAEKYAPEQMKVVRELSGVDAQGRWCARRRRADTPAAPSDHRT